MEYDFLQQFAKRMNSVGMYAMLMKNSWQKTTWKTFDIESVEEQLNIIFSVLLYMMEQSLEEEICTIDDIAAYLDDICNHFFRKRYSFEQSNALADFIVNVVLSDEGRAMYFPCFDFEKKEYIDTYISYIENRVVYLEDQTKRTSYKLTDQGYNLILSTLEMEGNMKLSVHEMIFRMHLERSTYDRALEEIKHIFNLLQIRLQKNEEALNRIRRNALEYSVAEYQKLLEENLETIEHTQDEFEGFAKLVRKRTLELEQANINVKVLGKEDAKKLSDLQKIERYLQDALAKHQKILGMHFDLKELYTRELEQLSQMAMIKRFSLRKELFDKVIEHPGRLTNLEYFLRPLFMQDPKKIYNLNRCLEPQKVIRKEKEEETQELIEFDAKEFEAEKERKAKKRLQKYKESLQMMLELAYIKKTITLKEIAGREAAIQKKIVCEVGIFKEIMVELIRNKEIDLVALQQEKKESFDDNSLQFHLQEMIYEIIKEQGWSATDIIVERMEPQETVIFENIPDRENALTTIRCSNVSITIA